LVTPGVAFAMDSIRDFSDSFFHLSLQRHASHGGAHLDVAQCLSLRLGVAINGVEDLIGELLVQCAI
jgi:hypothetical protein